jgi:hypothetical protein
MQTWVIYALLSMVFAGVTAVIAKQGLAGISGELGIVVRTIFLSSMTGGGGHRRAVGDTHISLLRHYRDKPLCCNALRLACRNVGRWHNCRRERVRNCRTLLSKLDTKCGRRVGSGQKVVSFQRSAISHGTRCPFVGRAGVVENPGTRFALTLSLSQRERGRHAALVVHPSSCSLLSQPNCSATHT